MVISMVLKYYTTSYNTTYLTKEKGKIAHTETESGWNSTVRTDLSEAKKKKKGIELSPFHPVLRLTCITSGKVTGYEDLLRST